MFLRSHRSIMRVAPAADAMNEICHHLVLSADRSLSENTSRSRAPLLSTIVACVLVQRTVAAQTGDQAMIFRAVSGLMALLFAYAVLLQRNDPDPLRWMAIYGAAALVSAIAALSGSASVGLSIVVGVIAFVWSVWTAPRSVGPYTRMFESWEMKSVPVEEAREATGLLIVAAWMAVNVLHK
jgi:hypothetical protein